MIKGVHTMFCSAEADALRAFVRDKLGFPHTDIGRGVEFTSDLKETSHGRVTHFKMPGAIEVQLCQPYDKKGATS